MQTLLPVDACGAFASTMAETEMSSPTRSCGERDGRMVDLTRGAVVFVRTGEEKTANVW